MRLAPRLRTLKGSRIGFLSSPKPNCEPFVRELADVLSERSRLGEVFRWRNSSAYRPVSARMAKQIHENCDALVMGPGD